MATSVTLDGVTFTDTDFQDRGHLDSVTVGGTAYPRFQALWVAGVNEITTRIGQVGGLGVAMAYAAETGSTADAAPGDGKLTWNNATQASATTIYLDADDANGTDITALIDTLDDSSSTIKGTLRLTQRDDNTKWIVYNLTAVTSASGYRKLTVTAVDYSATTPFADGANLTLTFSRTGDKGETGALNLTIGTLTGDVNGAGYDFVGLQTVAARYGTALDVNGNAASLPDFSTRPISRLTNSNDLSTDSLTTHWGRTNVTVSKNTTSPVGDAWTITASGSSTHAITAKRGPNSASPWDYVAAALVKAGTSSKVRVRVAVDSYGKGAYIDANLSTGATITAGALSTGTLLDSGVFPVGDSWYIVWVAGDVGSDGGVVLGADVFVLDSGGNDSYTAAGETILFGGCALYEGSTFKGFQNVGSSAAGSADLSGVVTTDAAGQSKLSVNESAGSTDTDLTVDGAQFLYLNLTADHTINVFGGEPDANGAYVPNGWRIEVVNDVGGSGGRDLTVQKGNLLTLSEQFDNAAWTKSAITVSANSAVGPRGDTVADKLIANTSDTSHYLARSSTVVSGQNYTYSILAKAAEYNFIAMATQTGAASGSVGFSLSAETMSTVAGTLVGSGIRDVGDGWYLCWITFLTTGTTFAPQIRLVRTLTTFDSHAGNDSDGLLIAGAQLAPGTEPRGYIPVGASRALDGWIGTAPDWASQAAGTKTVISVLPPLTDGTLKASDVTGV